MTRNPYIMFLSLSTIWHSARSENTACFQVEGEWQYRSWEIIKRYVQTPKNPKKQAFILYLYNNISTICSLQSQRGLRITGALRSGLRIGFFCWNQELWTRTDFSDSFKYAQIQGLLKFESHHLINYTYTLIIQKKLHYFTN